MCRIESPALQQIESRDARARLQASEDRLREGLECHLRKGLERLRRGAGQQSEDVLEEGCPTEAG